MKKLSLAKRVANLFYVNFYTFLLFQTIIIQISVLFIISFRPFIPSLPLQELVLDLKKMLVPYFSNKELNLASASLR